MDIKVYLWVQKSKKLLLPLLKNIDVIVEQFRPGVMKRLGLDFYSIKKINPKIIYVSISGYGQDGPKSQIAGHDLNYISTSGLLSLSMGKKDHPIVPPALIADIGAGSYPTIFNILLALRKRDIEKKHQSYGTTSGGDEHTLITEWLAVGHDNSVSKSHYGIPNKFLEKFQEPRTAYALFYLMRDRKNHDEQDDIPTLGYHLRFNNNSMPMGSYYTRDEEINAQLREEFSSIS